MRFSDFFEFTGIRQDAFKFAKNLANAEWATMRVDQTLVEFSLRVKTGMIQNSNGALYWVIVEVQAPLIHRPSGPWKALPPPLFYIM